MSAIKFNCRYCQSHIVVDERGAGMELPCPHCSRLLLIPAPEVTDLAPKVITISPTVPESSPPKLHATIASPSQTKAPPDFRQPVDLDLMAKLGGMLMIVGIVYFILPEFGFQLDLLKKVDPTTASISIVVGFPLFLAGLFRTIRALRARGNAHRADRRAELTTVFRRPLTRKTNKTEPRVDDNNA